MKATGMVRRMDELGRVVIPKEIRRTMHLHEGEELEIYAHDEGLFMKKYSALSSLQGCAIDYVQGLSSLCEGVLAIADTDCVLAASDTAKEATGQTLTAFVAAKMKQRALWMWQAPTAMVKQGQAYPYGVLCPILVRGDLFGALLWGHTSPCDARQLTILQTAAAILQQQLGN